MKDRRRADLAKIHLAKKQLGLDDDTYRDILWTVARVRSAADLDSEGRRQVLEHFRAKGFKPKRSNRPRPSSSRDPLLRKIDAILINADPPRQREYVEKGMLKRMFGTDAPARLEWATPEQLHKVVAALMYDQKRRTRA